MNGRLCCSNRFLVILNNGVGESKQSHVWVSVPGFLSLQDGSPFQHKPSSLVIVCSRGFKRPHDEYCDYIRTRTPTHLHTHTHVLLSLSSFTTGIPPSMNVSAYFTRQQLKKNKLWMTQMSKWKEMGVLPILSVMVQSRLHPPVTDFWDVYSEGEWLENFEPYMLLSQRSSKSWFVN